jgi:hypothetical protein
MSTRRTDQSSVRNGHSVGAPTKRRSLRRAPFRRLLALVALSTTLLGAGVMTGLLFAVGAVGETSSSASTTASASSSTGWASAIYAKPVPGVVAITAGGITSSSGESQIARRRSRSSS